MPREEIPNDQQNSVEAAAGSQCLCIPLDPQQVCNDASDFQGSLDSYLEAMQSYLDHIKAQQKEQSEAQPKVIWLSMSKVDESQVGFSCVTLLFLGREAL